MFEPLPMLMGLFTYPRSELSSIYHKDVTVMLLMNYSHSAVLNLLPIYHLAVIKLVLVVGITSSCPYRVAIVLRCHQPIAKLSAKKAFMGIILYCLLGNTSMSMSACDNPCLSLTLRRTCYAPLGRNENQREAARTWDICRTYVYRIYVGYVRIYVGVIVCNYTYFHFPH